MANEVLKELEAWQEATIMALVGQREEIAKQANETITKVNEAIEQNAKMWGNGLGEGNLGFERRGEKFVLVRIAKEKENSKQSEAG